WSDVPPANSAYTPIVQRAAPDSPTGRSRYPRTRPFACLRDPVLKRQSLLQPQGALARRWPTAVNRLGRIRRDIQHGAMMIRVATFFVVPVLGHEFYDLQCACRAVDVGKLHVGLKRRGRFGSMLPKPVGQHRNSGWVVDLR